MKPRIVLVLSLLAASGIHTVILLVPHFPGGEAVAIPTIELSLSGVGSPAGAGVGAAPLGNGPRAASAPPPSEPASRVDTSSLPEPERTAEPAAASEPAVDQVTAAQTTVARPDDDVASLPSAGGAGTSTGPGSGTGAGVGTGAGPGTGSGTGSGPIATTALLSPQPRSDIQPDYPRSARRAGWEGVVRISASVDELGMVVSAEVAVSSGHDVLDQAALEAVRRTFFTPARQNGMAIACRVIIPVRFQLK